MHTVLYQLPTVHAYCTVPAKIVCTVLPARRARRAPQICMAFPHTKLTARGLTHFPRARYDMRAALPARGRGARPYSHNYYSKSPVCFAWSGSLLSRGRPAWRGSVRVVVAPGGRGAGASGHGAGRPCSHPQLAAAG